MHLGDSGAIGTDPLLSLNVAAQNKCIDGRQNRMQSPVIMARVSAVKAAGSAAQVPCFSWPIRVYYEDTDVGGVVYYANYLRFFERCRTEWLRSLGFGQREMAERDSVVFVVAGAQIRYLRSSYLDDELRIDAHVGERGASYLVFEQQAWRGDELLSHARVKVACVDALTMRPKRIPPALGAALEQMHPKRPA